MEDEKKEYYLATIEGREVVLYKSGKFALSELDIINLIKICLVQRRAVDMGKRILEIYKDSTHYKKEKTDIILNKIGIENGEEKPTRIRKTKNK